MSTDLQHTSAPVAARDWEAAVREESARLEERLVAIRRHLHAHPEPSRAEVETSRYIAAQLESAGLTARLCHDGLGVIADVDVGEPADDAARVAIRADIDALKIQDTKTVPYASRNPGCAHACGHDAHAAVVLGTALCGKALGENGAVPGARLRFVFQPAEETSDGARWMVEQGAVDDVAAIIGLHVDPERSVGTVGIRYGALTANCDEIELTIRGRGGHSARPHHSDDPIAATAALVNALYSFLPRSVDSRDPAVFSIGKIAGGTLPNVIPDRVDLLGSLRTVSHSGRERLKRRVEEIVHGIREASGADIHLEMTTPIDAVINHPVVTEALERSATSLLGGENVEQIDLPSMGGEDFSAYLTRVPGAMLRLGVAPPGFQAPYLHAPDFDVDERALLIGTRVLLSAALNLSQHPPSGLAIQTVEQPRSTQQ